MLLPCMAMAGTDAENALDSIVRNVRANCDGISNDLTSLKKMAGIGTIVNAAGTLAGAGGVASGVAKMNADSNTEELLVLEQSTRNKAALANFKNAIPNIDWNAVETHLNQLTEEDKNPDNIKKQINASQEKSDKYGNIRTGLFAANTATSVAGAVVSSKAKVDESLEERIKACTQSLSGLNDAITRVRVEDGVNANTEKLTKSKNIWDKCGQYKNVNTDSLNKLAKAAMVSGVVGGATGTAATITSVSGTKNKMSDVDLNSADAANDINKIENINVASNVLGGVTAVSSLTGTILNAAQKKRIQEVVTIAENCEEALQ